MSRPLSQPETASIVIQELLAWVPKHCINGTKGPAATPNLSFMPLPTLEAYLKAESRINRLLRALYWEREHHISIETMEERCIRVFTILTLIGRGRYIEHFVQYPSLCDARLPFLEKPGHFPTDPDDPTFWERFYKEQFAFCAHHFRKNEHYNLEDLCILPIVSKELLGSGGSAAIYKIKLYYHYDGLNTPAESPFTQGSRPPNTYVLKTYNTRDADKYYENEVEAFKKIASKDKIDKSFIRFLGNYKQGDSRNILLEYADGGTLEDYFQRVTPPSLDEDIIMFWGRFFNVLKALQCIHATERPDGFDGPDVLIGWHQDVKPRNILIVSGDSSHPYNVHFKLGDLGLSHFKSTARMDGKTSAGDVGGTKDYGAPECHRSDDFLERSKLSVKPSVDIWSFGGVCSEAAVWVVLGKSGLNDYRSQRQQEIAGKNTSQDGSCFHDGERALRTVEDMHRRLVKRGEVRPGDYVTKPVVQDLVPTMLEEEPDFRLNALLLWKKTQRILSEARSELEEANQQESQAPTRSSPGKAQFFGQNMPETPPRTSHGGASSSNGNAHSYGPPPNLAQYRSNFPTPRRSLSIKQIPRTQSDIWHEQPVSTENTRTSHHGNLSPIASHRHSFKGSPPLGIHLQFRDRTDGRATSVADDANRPGAFWQNVGSLYNNQPDGSNDVDTPERRSGPPQFVDQFSSLGLNSEPHIARAQQNQSDAGLDPIPLHDKQRSPPTTPNPPTFAPPASKSSPDRPHLSYKAAKQIREKHGVLPAKAQGLLNDLKDRDHVFLMDDSLSMKEHWDDVVDLFSVFAWYAKRLDDNGLEMYFTVSTNTENFRRTTPAVSRLRMTRHHAYSNMDMRLGQILRTYLADLERSKERKGFPWRSKAVKPLSLYVFTDAAWPGCDAVAPIEATIEKLKQLALPKEQIGIQFIRFGNDPTGISRLEYLDSGLRKTYGKKHDIVDTEPFVGGNVLKMLLGAISEWFDDD